MPVKWRQQFLLAGQVLASGQHRPAKVTAAVLWYTGVLLLGRLLSLAEEPLRYLAVRSRFSTVRTAAVAAAG